MAVYGPWDDNPDAPGYAGPGDFDAAGNWVPKAPGTTLNSVPRPITTPNSSTGQPAFADPSAPATQFATPQGGQLTTTPNSSTGAPAPGIRTLPATTGVGPTGGWGDILGGGLQAVLPASTLLSGAASGNKRVQEILKQSHPDWSDQDMRNWLEQQRTGGNPQSTTLPTGLPGPMPVTQTGAGPQTIFPPMPPSGGPSTGGGAQALPPPPTAQAPIPTGQPPLPQPNYPYPPPRPRSGRSAGGGVRGDGTATTSPAAPPAAAPPSPGEYFATSGNARSGVFTPGGFQPGPHFYTPVSGPDLRFGPGQWSPAQAAPQGGGGYNVNGMFANLPNDVFNGAVNHPAVQAAARHPAVRAAVAQQMAAGPEDPSITARGGVPSGPYAGMAPGTPGVDPSIAANRQILAQRHPGALAGANPFWTPQS